VLGTPLDRRHAYRLRQYYTHGDRDRQKNREQEKNEREGRESINKPEERERQ